MYKYQLQYLANKVEKQSYKNISPPSALHCNVFEHVVWCLVELSAVHDREKLFCSGTVFDADSCRGVELQTKKIGNNGFGNTEIWKLHWRKRAQFVGDKPTPCVAIIKHCNWDEQSAIAKRFQVRTNFQGLICFFAQVLHGARPTKCVWLVFFWYVIFLFFWIFPCVRNFF